MTRAVFPYPGGKSHLADWILEQLPERRTFVEVFGGAAGILFNKQPSKVEVYNDMDADLVHFFEVLRDNPEELVEWLERTPYSRDLHDDWAGAFYNGYRPNESIERAGQFFYLRYSQWGGKYDKNSGLGTAKTSSRAAAFANKRKLLTEFADRFEYVVIENLDWREIFEKYDSEHSAFYCDPPYVDQGSYYPEGGIDHDSLIESVEDLEGDCVISYSELPERAEDLNVLEQWSKNFMGNGKSGSSKQTVDRLGMNFDP